MADKDQEATIDALLGTRTKSLRIRPVSYEILPHPGHDPSCRTSAAEFLRSFSKRFQHALVVFDREGSGGEPSTAEQLEESLEVELDRNGWGDRARAIVIDPEVECWVWSDSTEVDRIMGWSGRIPALRAWMVDEGHLTEGEPKPDRPKEAFRAALREVRKQPSSALFRQLATTVSLKSCSDRAFRRFCDTVREWFPSRP